MLRLVTKPMKAPGRSLPRHFINLQRLWERYLKHRRSNRLYIASSVSEKTLVANSDERLRSILMMLEKSRAALFISSSPETAHILSVAILDLRMKLNRIADSELKALCDAMLPVAALAEGQSDQKGQRRGTPLKVVK
jgi:hypothetical protein